MDAMMPLITGLQYRLESVHWMHVCLLLLGAGRLQSMGFEKEKLSCVECLGLPFCFVVFSFFLVVF